jgi:DNA-directed RNA polymerase subunit RPC12/RpoP
MDSIKIHGKDYITVNERVKYFRAQDEYKGWSIESDITNLLDNEVIVKTIIRDTNGNIKSSGMAHEVKGSSHINNGSHIENAETSSVGRALGFLGIGIDTSIASADEVQNAVQNRPVSSQPTRQANTTRQAPKPVRDEIRDDSEHLCSQCGSETEFKSGVSKSGKEWKGNRCVNCGHMDWVND